MFEEVEKEEITVFEYTDAVYSREDNTTIDMIWNHPEFGPIPFTLIEIEYPDFWEQVITTGNINPYVEPIE